MKLYVNKYRYIIYGTVMVVISILLFWKCKYGYATLDEAFYPTIAFRFLQGDKILYDEWNNTQLSALVIMPVLKLYKTFVGSYDGIYLFIRYFYTILKILISVLAFFSLKELGEKKAFFASSFFLIISCYGLMVISYNSIAVGGMFCSIIFLFYSTTHSTVRRVSLFLAGMSLAIAVLGIPYVIGVYVVYIICILFVTKRNVVDERIKAFYSWNSLLWVTIGALSIAVVTLCYVFHNVSIKQVLTTVPYIVNGDPAHLSKSFYRLTLAYLVRIFLGNHKNYYIFAVYAVMGAISLLYLLSNNKKPIFSGNTFLKFIGKRYIVFAGTLSTVILLLYVLFNNYINDIIFVPNIMAFLLFIVMADKDKMIRELFCCYYLPGMLFTYFEYIASNTGFSGIAASSLSACIASILIIIRTIEVLFIDEKRMAVTLLPFLIFVFTLGMYYRLTYVFWEDGGISSLTKRIDFGVAQGLLVTEKEEQHFIEIMEDTEEIRNLPQNEMVLYVGDKILWLAGNQRCASYSPLTYSIESTPGILFEYYKVHPDRVADVIYIEKNENSEKLVEEISEKMSYIIERKNSGWVLKRK